jgi:hypothetical protein
VTSEPPGATDTSDAGTPEPLADPAASGDEREPADAAVSAKDVPPQATQSDDVPAAKPFWTKEYLLAFGGIVAAIITALVTPLVAYITTQNLNTEQFQRTESKNAYSQLIAKALVLEKLERSAQDPDSVGGFDRESKSRALNAVLMQLQSAYDEMNTADAAVELAGSLVVREKALNLLEAHQKVGAAFEILNSDNPPATNPHIIPGSMGALKNYIDARHSAIDARIVYVEQARGDLGFSTGGEFIWL